MILNILEQLAATTKPSEKLAILKDNEDKELLKDVIYQAMSPRVKYYIKKIPEVESSEKMNLPAGMQGLRQISDRTLTGDDAIGKLMDVLRRLSVDNAEVIKRVIRKDLRINCGAKMINKVWPKLIEVTPYMGAIPFNQKKARKLFEKGNSCCSQIKMDGRYANMIIDEEGSIRLESRQGEETYLFDKFWNLPVAFRGMVLNGELTIPNVDRYTSNGIIASIVSIGKKYAGANLIDKEMDRFKKKHGMLLEETLTDIVYTVWDAIPLEVYYEGKYDVAYGVRYLHTSDLVASASRTDIQLISTKKVNSYEEAMEEFHEKLKDGEEGTILKSWAGVWKNGKPNWQIKMKLEFSCDLKVTGFNPGKPHTRLENTLGSIECSSSDGKLITNPSGLTDMERKAIWSNQDKYLGTILEVTCSGVSHDLEGNHSLLHPRCKLFRDDKTKADGLEDILKNEAMITGLGS